MPVENSELNTSGALRSSNAGLTGGTGTGNKLLVSDLAQGFTHEADPTDPFWRLPGDEAAMVMPTDGGFAGRPHGWER